MSNSNKLFTTMPVGQAVAKLAIPTVVSQIIVILYSLADTFFIGQIGDPNQLAALSITFPIYTLLTAVANLFGIGANSVIARSLGQNNEETAKKTSSFSFWGSIIVTAVLSILLAVFMKPILTFFGADSYTLGYTSDYLFWVFVIGGIPTVAGLLLGHLVRAVGKTQEAGIGLTIGGIMNIILDPVFIFLFHLDVAGAAIATMISNTISMIYFLIVLYRIRKSVVLTLSPKHFSLQKDVSLATLAVGFPAAISVLLLSVSISLLNGLLLKHENGNILSAAYGVTSKCGTIALHLSIGVAQGVMPLIGYSYGAKNHKRVHDVCSLSFKILLVFSLIFLVIIQLMPEVVVGIFTPNQETIRVGSTFMRCWSWCVIGMSLFNMYNSIFQAVGKWKTSLVLAVLRLGVIFTILSLVLDALFGVTGLMWVQAITDTLTCLIAFVLYEKFKKEVTQEIVDNPEEKPLPIAHHVITISRQFGSGGRTIGKKVAEELGIPCYDDEIIDAIAKESGLAKEYVASHAEAAISDEFYGNIIAGRDRDWQSIFDKIWFAQKKVILDLVSKEPCVIVGTCADYIIRDSIDYLSVFVHASDEKRAERIVTVYGEREESPAQRLHDKDAKRKAYYQLYTGTEWGNADNYELCLDSGKIGIDGCVKLISQLYKNKLNQTA